MDKKAPDRSGALGRLKGTFRLLRFDFMPPTETREITPSVWVHPEEER
jgi:hypothetical protein